MARWVVPILIIVGIAIGAVAWYSRNRYYVGFDQARVTVYRGVPGGLLIWDPTIVSRTRITASDLTAAERVDVRGNKKFSSKSDAAAYVTQLRAACGTAIRPLPRRRRTTTVAPTTTTAATPPGAAPTPAAPAAGTGG